MNIFPFTLSRKQGSELIIDDPVRFSKAVRTQVFHFILKISLHLSFWHLMRHIILECLNRKIKVIFCCLDRHHAIDLFYLDSHNENPANSHLLCKCEFAGFTQLQWHWKILKYIVFMSFVSTIRNWYSDPQKVRIIYLVFAPLIRKQTN